jgi:spore maturation protein CgeB
MKPFRILAFIPANGYHVALDAIEALKELDQLVVILDLREIRRELLSQSIEAAIKRFRPDFIFTTNGVGLVSGLFDELEIPYISWWTIDPANLKPPPSPFYHIFIIDKTRLLELREEGYKSVHYLPFGVNPNRFRPISLSKDDMRRWGCDVSFAGAANFSMGYLEHKEYFDSLFGKKLTKTLLEEGVKNPRKPLQKLYKEITGDEIRGERLVDLRRIEYEAMRLWRREVIRSLSEFGIVVCGDDGWRELSKDGILYKGYLKGDDLLKLYKASKINLSLQISTMKGSLNKRTFEIPAAGGFLVGSFREPLVWHFEDGREVVYFREDEELKDLIRYYLHHPDERREIAKRARERVLKEHTFLHRMKKLIGIMEDSIGK